MHDIKSLPPESLYHHCPPEQFDFEDTSSLEDLPDVIGQERATQAVQFGISMPHEGYNLFVMGPPGMGKHTMVRQYLDTRAVKEVIPPDWCYVNNFEQPHKPIALRLPPGVGERLRKDMDHLIDELSATLPAAFESDEYHARVQELEDELKTRQEKAFSELADDAMHKHVKLFRTPSGFAFAPLRDDEVIGPEDFDKLPEKEQDIIQEKVANLQEHLQVILKKIPQWRKETRQRLKALNREVAMAAVGHLIDEFRNTYDDLPEVLAYLDSVEHDIIENVKDFIKTEESGLEIIGMGHQDHEPRHIHRYKVNVLVNNSQTEGAPVVYLDNPTYLNLVGRAEHYAQFGALVTDFTLLKPGALQQANDGYLIVDARKLLTHPYAWEGLKRALFSSEIRIESLEKMLGLLSTTTLEPEPIPLNIKIILVGERMLYYLLHAYDPEFAELFKVQADFEHHIPRNEENNQLYARLIATLARKALLRPLDRHAVARVIEYGSRHIEDAEQLTTHMRSIADLLREADYWAGQNQASRISAEDIQKSIDQQLYRASRIQETIAQEIKRGTILIDTDGAKIGQVNGLSVLSMADHHFGQPSRITATTHIGEGSVIDIEREVELGGAIHSKGVLILSSFLAERYAQKHPLSLSASLVFEQSYGMVEGDSASMAELCALLSALAGVPIRQSYAMTGSVNQKGESQAIGGVNEKIEGFFRVCKERGLNGQHGVLIPNANVKHLMIDREVVEAARDNQFAIYAMDNVDQAMELLTGLSMGEMDENGDYPEDSINGRVIARLREMAEIRHAFGEHGKDPGDPEAQS